MKGKILLLFSLLFINYSNSQNLLTNPSFELGGSGVGFVTNGAGYTQLGTPYTGTTTSGNFAVINNPNTINTANFIFEGDHTTGVGRMLVIDGNTTAGNPRFWRAGNTGAGITTLTIGTTYRFSYWIKSISNLGSPADIGIQIIGGTAPVLTSGATIAPAPAQSWRQVIYTFVATATTAQIELWNANTAAIGNDFAVDDFILTSSLVVHPEVTNAVCATANDGALNVTGFGGTPPYVNYAITGPVNQNNATGLFPNLPPGTYTVSVTDSTLPTALTATLTTIFVGPKITVPVNSPICLGSSFQLNANGSPAGYSWTSVPAGFVSNTANPSVTPAVNTVYTVTSTVGACAPISASVSITVNPLPNISNASLVQTICPGNTASFTITGTPNSTVTLSNPSVIPFTSTVNIGPAGTGVFITPVLTASVIYNFVKIRGFFTLCERDLASANLTLTINVVPNGCATVRTDPAPNTPPLDLTLCTTGECRTLEANFSPVPSTTGYAASSIPYCPYPFIDPDPTTAPVYNVVNITSGDDFWSDVIPLPFNFCFYGQNYTQCNAGTNGLITFVPKTLGQFCPWPSTGVPIAGQNQSQSIFGVYQDTDFSIPPSAANRQVNWVLEGQYPCRKLIVSFYNMGQWNSTGSNPGLQTSQIVLYEVSNIIEVFVQRRVAGTPWAGSGAIGLIGNGAAQSVAAPGRDTGNWSVLTSEAWRFTPTGPNVPVTIDWFEGTVATGTFLGSGPTQVVCPAVTTTYTLQATYQVCGVPQTATTTTTLNVFPDLTGTPNDITECVSSFNLNPNTGVILGALSPIQYDITYHTSAVEAEFGQNPIPFANLATYSPGAAFGTYTVYASIFLNSQNCHVVKAFNLIYSDCSIFIGNVPDLTVCDDISNDGIAPFDFRPQVIAALDTNNAADYTITFHLTQLDANNPASTGITPIFPFNGTDGQIIVVRIMDNTDNTIFTSTTFTLNINTFANAGTDGSISVCETSTTPINLFNLITGEQTGGTWVRTGTGTGGVFNAVAGTFTPAVGATTSTFEYTVIGVAPCVDDTSVATVTIIPQPTAGADGGIVICASSATPIDLFSLITGEQTGGTWIRTGTGTGGVFNAAAGTFTPTAGATTSTFEYTIIGAAPCINDVSVATVTISGQPNAGSDGSISVCETSTTAIDLYSLITGEQTGGGWTRTGTGGTFDAINGTFTPAIGASNSTFTYTLSGVAPCITDTSEVVVTIVPQPTAGTDGSATVCETSTTPIDLFSLITGEQAGGVWTRTLPGTGGTFNAAAGTYTPAVGSTTSTFTYTVTGAVPCTTDSSTVIITINPQPTAGNDGSIAVCETSTTVINLFNLITGEQAGGVWTRTGSGTGGTFNAAAGTFIPALGATTSDFTYTITGTLPCAADSSVATITINAQPTAGTDGASTVCETSTTPIDLFSLITGEQAGGVWIRTLPGTGGTFNAAAGTFTPAVGATTSTFTYTVTGTVPCTTDSSTVIITINPQPTAGNDGSTTVCETSTTVINLFNLITGEQAGGVWTRTGSGTGGTFNAAAGTFTPALGATTSDFTYTVTGSLPCAADSSVATVTINAQPTAGADGASTVCETSATTIDLFSLITGEQAGGVWTRTLPGTGGIFNAAGGTFTTAIGATTSNFTYTVTGVAPCTTDTSIATVTIIAAPVINTPSDYVVCDDSLNNDGLFCAFNLTIKDAEITAAPNVVSYYETQTDAELGGITNQIVGLYCNIDNFDQEIFVRVVNPAAPTCYSITSFHLIVNPIPIPNGNIADYELCDYNAPVNQETFNLGTMIPQITSLPGVTVRFYDNLADAQNPTTATPLPILYSNTSNPQQIWFNISDTVSGCNTTGSFNLVVNPLPIAVAPQPIFECSNGLTLDAIFDLTVNRINVTNGVPGLTVSYYNTLLDAQNGNLANAIQAPNNYPGTDNEIIYIRVENNVTGCYVTTTQLLRVTQGPIAISPLPLQYCDPDNDGFGEFDLNTATNLIAGGILPPGVSVSYHETPDDANIGASPIDLSVLYSNIRPWSQILYVRVFYTLTGCANFVQLKLNVNPTPEATVPPDYELCDTSGLVGFETFNLTTPALWLLRRKI